MKLSQMYCTPSGALKPVVFSDGFNCVCTTKSSSYPSKHEAIEFNSATICQFLDFCLLSTQSLDFSLSPHSNIADLALFLEIALQNHSYLTVRRSIAHPNIVAFKSHTEGLQDFTNLTIWDEELPVDRARSLMNNLWAEEPAMNDVYRTALDDLLWIASANKNVLLVPKKTSELHKPVESLNYLLGLDQAKSKDLTDKVARLVSDRAAIKAIKNDLVVDIEDEASLEGLILLKTHEAEQKQASLDALDLSLPDKVQTDALINDYDTRIAQLNEQRYYIGRAIHKLESTLRANEITFDINETQTLFDEAQVAFKGQLKKSFSDLVTFNKAISIARHQQLKEELLKHHQDLIKVNDELDKLEELRAQALTFLRSTDVFDKRMSEISGLRI